MADLPQRNLTKSNAPFQRAAQRLPLGVSPSFRYRGDDRVDAATLRGMQVGKVFALSAEKELVDADRIAKLIPAAELLRFSNSGTGAVMAALRLARAYTLRESYQLVEGGYHGLFDAAMGMANMVGWETAVLAPFRALTPPRLTAQGNELVAVGAAWLGYSRIRPR